MYSWQEWLSKNYTLLSTWSKRWHATEWRELMAHMTLYLEKNWSKFSKIPDGEQRIKFLQTWMKNNVRWKNSDFNKSIEVNNFDDNFQPLDSEYEEPIVTLAEDMTDDIKEFVIDLNRRFDEVDVVKIITIRKVYLQLLSHERVLYDLYFTQMLSIRAVAKKLQLPSSSVHIMIVALRKKIKDLC